MDQMDIGALQPFRQHSIQERAQRPIQELHKAGCEQALHDCLKEKPFSEAGKQSGKEPAQVKKRGREYYNTLSLKNQQKTEKMCYEATDKL